TVEHAHFYESECARFRKEQPLVESDSIDVIVSNCVLNLVRTDEKKKLFAEMHRVLKEGGRAIISDIVCDEDPSDAILNDPELWSGCISGAFREDDFLQKFIDAGFHAAEILVRQEEPWHVIDGIEFRSMTVRAYKGEDVPCLERNQAVVYKGPWKSVTDEEGHVYPRGQRMAVCDKTYNMLTSCCGPYAGQFSGIEPNTEIPLEEAECYDCSRDNTIRHPRESKGENYRDTIKPADDEDSCSSTGCC
ncbi:MAG: methyltransferase domain-containing protein, partial [Verrucomicrobiota bacterium]